MDWNPSARKRWSIPHPACFLLSFQLKHEVFRRFLYKLYGMDVRSNSRGLLQRQVQVIRIWFVQQRHTSGLKVLGLTG